MKKIYVLVFLSLILSSVAIALVLLAYFDNKVLDDATSYITILMGIIGVMFAFSAISIYSVFNANIDNTQKRLEKDLREFKEVQKSELDNHRSIIDEKLAIEETRIKAILDRTKLIQELNYRSYNLSRVLAEYFPIEKRIIAILELKREYEKEECNKTVFKKGTGDILWDYYKALESQQYDETFYVCLKDFIVEMGYEMRISSKEKQISV